MRRILILLLAIFLLNLHILPIVNAQSEGEVGVSATVSGCNARILVKPEKRWPREGNFSNRNQIVFYNQLYQELYEFNDVQTSNDGYANIDLCSEGYTTEPGIYSIYVKGFSHLGKLYIQKEGFFNYTTFFDLARTPDEYLWAGDILNHDYVNGLDLDISISKLYTDDIKSDLNRDGIVNSLDLSNLIYNLHRAGQLGL